MHLKSQQKCSSYLCECSATLLTLDNHNLKNIKI